MVSGPGHDTYFPLAKVVNNNQLLISLDGIDSAAPPGSWRPTAAYIRGNLVSIENAFI